MVDIKEVVMSNNTKQSEVWQSGYISNNTRLHEIDLSRCDKSKVQVYSHPTSDNKSNKK